MKARAGWLGWLWLIAVCALAHDTGRPLKPIPIPPQGVAEAVIAKEADLPGGPKAEGKPGDMVLRNHQVTFVVAGARPTSGYSRYGGRLLDAILNEGGHDADLLGEMFLGAFDARGLMNARTLRAEKVTIVSAGGEDKPAVVQVEAVDERFPIVDQALRVPSNPIGLKVILTYTLPPDTPTLLIEGKLINTTGKPQNYTLVLGWIQGEGMRMYLPPFGSAAAALRKAAGPPLMGLLSTIRASFPFVANAGSRLAYGVYPLEGDFGQIQKAEEIYLITLLNNAPVPPAGEVTVRWALTVSDGELETIRREKRRLQSVQEELHTLRGRVVNNNGKPVPDARVYLFERAGNEDRFTTLALTDSRGEFTARLPEGEWRGMVFADHHSPQEFTVRLPSEQPVQVQLAAPALLAIRVLDERRRPSPCAVVFDRLGGKLPNAERVLYGEEGDFGRFERVHFSLKGDEILQVEPGRYRVTLTRGFEYEIAQREITLQSDTQERFEAVLQQTAPMPGYLSGDFHVHAIPSPDSNDYLADKVKAYLAAGVQILTATDHDVNTDYMPVIRQLGVQHLITSIVGTEITPIWALGHFNAYPQRYDPSLPNNGAVVWYDLNAAQIFEAARKNYDGDVIVQVNHPRSGGMGYFAYVGLDPQTGEIKRANEFADNFDAIEVFNGTDVNMAQQVMRDWFHFLNQGKRYLAMGNTDSHHAYRLEPGFPRTYIYFGHREPRRVTPRNLTEALRRGDVVVCGGAVLTFTATDPANPRRTYRIGETVPLRGNRIRLNIEVRAPSWVRVNTLQVIVNGEVVQELPLNQPENAPLNFQRTLDITIPVPQNKETSWLILLVRGDRFTALYPGTFPLSFTNPLYIRRSAETR
ncbi:hypothetical protein HRbin15_01680 [bacterium HR15]|nr:hypothetical protein HRbin15_01680 [bacterium HR15]